MMLLILVTYQLENQQQKRKYKEQSPIYRRILYPLVMSQLVIITYSRTQHPYKLIRTPQQNSFFGEFRNARKPPSNLRDLRCATNTLQTKPTSKFICACIETSDPTAASTARSHLPRRPRCVRTCALILVNTVRLLSLRTRIQWLQHVPEALENPQWRETLYLRCMFKSVFTIRKHDPIQTDTHKEQWGNSYLNIALSEIWLGTNNNTRLYEYLKRRHCYYKQKCVIEVMIIFLHIKIFFLAYPTWISVNPTVSRKCRLVTCGV